MSESYSLYVKNMVCPRCIMAVKTVLSDMKLKYEEVKLGQVKLSEELPQDQRQQLGEKLQALGFELLEAGRSSLISQIKSQIIQQIHHADEPLQVNFSTYLAEKLQHDYSYLSRLFSSVEGITIEKFITAQKIERVKELLFYDELSLSEISYLLNYSSVAYLSTQFKKETGMTPTAFKKLNQPAHRSLDQTGRV